MRNISVGDLGEETMVYADKANNMEQLQRVATR